MTTLFRIELEGKLIGTTRLEKADAPMGVLTGEIEFSEITSGCEFFRDYAKLNKLKLNLNDDNFRTISTPVIDQLRVFKADNSEIKGQGNYVAGIDGDKFEITILGYPYPDFEIEFPHHVKAYYGGLNSDHPDLKNLPTS